MNIESFKHNKDKRPFIPSSEEAGAENSSPALENAPTTAEFTKNPIVTRGQDPELFWMHKYGPDDTDDKLNVDIRSLYRHEHIAPETLIQRLYSVKELTQDQPDLSGLFGDGLEMDEMDKVSAYYTHQDGWKNRLIQGDSLLVMTSLLEREGLAGKVQCIYIDPPYGIKYGSNWQIKLNNRNVKDGADDDLCGEPEQIKAYRDTWELGIHSYLSYLRDRLLTARELLTESGSCFVQISDENIHLVRCLMDEVFGSDNFISLISFTTTSGFDTVTLARNGDYLLWYARDRSVVKCRKLFQEKNATPEGGLYRWMLSSDGRTRGLTASEIRGESNVPDGAKLYQPTSLISQGSGSDESRVFNYRGKAYSCGNGNHWKTTLAGMQSLASKGRIHVAANSIRFVRLASDFPYMPFTNFWSDTTTGNFTDDKVYVVQTNTKVIQRCVLMTTDPGDLVLDPTCGSGTTAYVCEQWGRRWITIDTSRIALNIAKSRLMTSVYPYYQLHDDQAGDLRQGFKYKTVPHITLKSLAHDEPPEEETLYDQPEVDKVKLRVSGPFTVETLQSFEPVEPFALDEPIPEAGDTEKFEERVFEMLRSAGVMNGVKQERAVFTRIQLLSDSYLHAEGFFPSAVGEGKAYLHIGPKFGTVSRQAVNEAVKACRARGDADWLLILGFAFDSDIQTGSVTTSMGSFEVTKTRIHDDLMQDGLLKRDKKAAAFVTIGEPDIQLIPGIDCYTVRICGLDIYDPIKDEVKARDVADIAYWMVDDNYDGSNFIVKQVFFCGGDKDEFDSWKRGLNNLAAASARSKAEKTLKIEIDPEAFERIYGFESHPIPTTTKGRKIAVRVISQFGEESTKVLEV